MARLLITLLCLFTTTCFAQSPGQIVRPAGGGVVTILNPNGDGYSSASSAGFTTSDIMQSEIPYKVVPPIFTEPTGDIATGPAGGFTDIVKTVDNSGFYVFNDGINLLFRLRIGNIISGSKGYSILIDTDGKMGNSGPAADPNYIASTNTSNGNPGFEYEVILQTNFQVAVYQVDGSTSPGAPVATYSLATNSQISMALTTDGNNPDYFYDWYVPLSVIGSPSSFRLVATTVTSPNSALQGSRSDIYGIDDATAGSVATAWTTVANAQPVISVSSLTTGGTGVSPVCTAPPVLNTPVNTGSNISVSGSWMRLDASKPSTATITIYKNGIAAGTVNTNSGSTWNIVVASINPGDVLYAGALAAGESQCLQSNNVTAGCASIPAVPTITCASSKGITGTIPLNTTVSIYQVSTTNANPLTTPLSTGLVYITNASDRTFNYYGTNPQSGNACQGQNGILTTNTTYMLVSNNNGCLSLPAFICITGASQNSWNYITSNTLSLTTPVYPFQTSINGSGATSGQLLRLFVNNNYLSSVTATGSAFSFTGLSLKAGDSLRVYAQTSGACMTASSGYAVSCYTQPPVIITNSSGNLLSSATAISGSSTAPGGTVNLYRGTAPGGTLIGTATTNSSGAWTVSSLVLAAGESYYATLTSSGCTSGASAAAGVLAPTSTCPAFSGATFAEQASLVGGSISSFSGTVRLYLDGVLIGSAALSNNTTWSIAVNTNYSNTLYPGGILTVTAQSATEAENVCGGSATVTCTPPAQPTVSPLTTTINTGQSIPFAISNVTSNTWYSIRDNTSTSYATSTYTSGNTNFTLTTNNFSNSGTYLLNIAADKLNGCASSLRLATVTVNSVSLPVTFLQISAKAETGLNYISWTVTNEQQVDHYEVERSKDCQNYAVAGQVAFKKETAANNFYNYSDNNTGAGHEFCYRVKQVDKNGRYTYSPTVRLLDTDHKLSYRVLPNPAYDRAMIAFQSPTQTLCTMSVVSMSGAILTMKRILIVKGSSVIEIPGINSLPAGSYSIQLNIQGTVFSQQLILR